VLRAACSGQQEQELFARHAIFLAICGLLPLSITGSTGTVFFVFVLRLSPLNSVHDKPTAWARQIRTAQRARTFFFARLNRDADAIHGTGFLALSQSDA